MKWSIEEKIERLDRMTVEELTNDIRRAYDALEKCTGTTGSHGCGGSCYFCWSMWSYHIDPLLDQLFRAGRDDLAGKALAAWIAAGRLDTRYLRRRVEDLLRKQWSFLLRERPRIVWELVNSLGIGI